MRQGRKQARVSAWQSNLVSVVAYSDYPEPHPILVLQGVCLPRRSVTQSSELKPPEPGLSQELSVGSEKGHSQTVGDLLKMLGTRRDGILSKRRHRNCDEYL